MVVQFPKNMLDVLVYDMTKMYLLYYKPSE